MLNKKLILFFLIAVLLNVNSVQAAAQLSDGTGYLDTISQYFTTGFEAMSEKFQTAAKALFFSLAVISLTWTFGQIALKGGEVSSLMFEVMRATLVIGFFWWLITDAPNILFSLFDKFASWVDAETNIKGSSSSEVVDVGQDLFMLFFNQKIQWGSIIGGGLFVSIVGWIFGLILGVFGFVTSVFIALNLIIYLIEFHFLCYVGIFVLGVAGASWTRDIAISYVKKLIAISLSYMSLKILCGVTIDIVKRIMTQLQAEISTTTSWYDFFSANIEEIMPAYFTVFMVYLLVAKAMNSIPNAISNFFGQGAVSGYNPTLAAGAMAGALGYGGMKLAGMGIKGGAQGAVHGMVEGGKAFAGKHPVAAGFAKKAAVTAALATTPMGIGVLAAKGLASGLKGGINLAKKFGGK